MTPRLVTFIRVKRNLVVPGRSYGHWWLEVDGGESYGWWPDRMPVGVLKAVRGPHPRRRLPSAGAATPVAQPA